MMQKKKGIVLPVGRELGIVPIFGATHTGKWEVRKGKCNAVEIVHTPNPAKTWEITVTNDGNGKVEITVEPPTPAIAEGEEIPSHCSKTVIIRGTSIKVHHKDAYGHDDHGTYEATHLL